MEDLFFGPSDGLMLLRGESESGRSISCILGKNKEDTMKING